MNNYDVSETSYKKGYKDGYIAAINEIYKCVTKMMDKAEEIRKKVDGR